MKNCLYLLLLTLSATAFCNDVIDQYSKIQLREVSTTNDATQHAGLVLTLKDPVRLGVYGAKKNNTKFTNEKYSYDLLGEVEVSLVSVGVTVNLINTEVDSNFTLNNLDGSQLDDICGEYYGFKLGLALGLGTSAFSSVNSEGIILRSNASVLGWAKLDLSGVQTIVKCLDRKNPNWKKTVRF